MRSISPLTSHREAGNHFVAHKQAAAGGWGALGKGSFFGWFPSGGLTRGWANLRTGNRMGNDGFCEAVIFPGLMSALFKVNVWLHPPWQEIAKWLLTVCEYPRKVLFSSWKTNVFNDKTKRLVTFISRDIFDKCCFYFYRQGSDTAWTCNTLWLKNKEVGQEQTLKHSGLGTALHFTGE